MSDTHSVMLTALIRLRGSLQDAELPLDLPGIEEQRDARREMIDQLEDYAIPRLMTIDAPLLAVVGGSTGAGKSTLVNSLVGERVSEPGVLRPTTRSPVLVHHPDDTPWFDQQRILPELERTNRATSDPGALQLVASTAIPQGLALLDAPDIDSVEERNRSLAAQLLAAADLWLFVTSAARYVDQVPWGFLKQAAERSAAVAIVLDRTVEAAIPEVSSHLARMLVDRGLKDSPLFTVAEAPLDDRGLLPAESVADIRGWLVELGADGLGEVTWSALPVPRRLSVIEGRLDELLSDPSLAEYEPDWVSAVLTDEVRPLDAMARLQSRFPGCATLEHRPPHAAVDERRYAERIRGRSDVEVIDDFLAHVRGGHGASETERALALDALAQVDAEALR